MTPEERAKEAKRVFDNGKPFTEAVVFAIRAAVEAEREKYRKVIEEATGVCDFWPAVKSPPPTLSGATSLIFDERIIDLRTALDAARKELP